MQCEFFIEKLNLSSKGLSEKLLEMNSFMKSLA